MNSKDERRRASRRRVSWPVYVHTDQGDYVGQTIDVSETGISFYCDEPLKLKKTIHLSIAPPGRDAVKISGEITWSDLFGIDDDNKVVGFGLFFIKITEKDRQYLCEIVSATSN